MKKKNFTQDFETGVSYAGFDIIAQGEAKLTIDEDLDGKYPTVTFRIDSLKYKSKSQEFDIPHNLAFYFEMYIDTHLNDTVQKWVQTPGNIDFGINDQEPTAWDDLYQTLGNAFGDL